MSNESFSWLEDEDFILKTSFQDKYYLQSVCRAVLNYVRNAPFPVKTQWDNDSQSIKFFIGASIKKSIKVNKQVSARDFIVLIEKELKCYYPQYKISYVDQGYLNEDEILHEMQLKKLTFEEAISLRKEVVKEEYGIIDRVYLIPDEFRFTVNGESFFRMSGIPGQMTLSISKFMVEVRKLYKNKEDGLALRNYIIDNSIELRKIKKKSENINYSGYMMRNFFDINFYVMKDESFSKVDERHYRWGLCDIYFESDLLEKDCVNSYYEKLSQYTNQVTKENECAVS